MWEKWNSENATWAIHYVKISGHYQKEQFGWGHSCSWKHRYHDWGPDLSSSVAPRQLLLWPTLVFFSWFVQHETQICLQHRGSGSSSLVKCWLPFCCIDAVPQKQLHSNPVRVWSKFIPQENREKLNQTQILFSKSLSNHKLTSTPLWQGALESSRSQTGRVSWPGQSVPWGVPRMA